MSVSPLAQSDSSLCRNLLLCRNLFCCGRSRWRNGDSHACAGGVPEGSVEQERVVAEDGECDLGLPAFFGFFTFVASAVNERCKAGSLVQNELAVLGRNWRQRARRGRHKLQVNRAAAGQEQMLDPLLL